MREKMVGLVEFEKDCRPVPEPPFPGIFRAIVPDGDLTTAEVGEASICWQRLALTNRSQMWYSSVSCFRLGGYSVERNSGPHQANPPHQ